MKYLGVCAIAKDETPFLEEWVAFHTLLGVEKFVIYDNGSSIPIAETLKPYMHDDFITIIHNKLSAQQLPCYNHCLKIFRKEFAWLAFIDLDEFIVPKKVDDVRVMLTEFEKYAGFAANWKMFGSNGHKERPQGLQIENYTLSMPDYTAMNRHVKCVVNPLRVRGIYNPHKALPHIPYVIVNECHRPLVTPFSDPPSWDTCQINHYYYRSKQDFHFKLSRSLADSHKKHRIPEKVCPPVGDVSDLSATRYAPGTLQLMQMCAGCSTYATRLVVPATAQEAINACVALLNQGSYQDALVLIAKSRMIFPGHEVLNAMAERAAELLPVSGRLEA